MAVPNGKWNLMTESSLSDYGRDCVRAVVVARVEGGRGARSHYNEPTKTGNVGWKKREGTTGQPLHGGGVKSTSGSSNL